MALLGSLNMIKVGVIVIRYQPLAKVLRANKINRPNMCSEDDIFSLYITVTEPINFSKPASQERVGKYNNNNVLR